MEKQQYEWRTAITTYSDKEILEAISKKPK